MLDRIRAIISENSGLPVIGDLKDNIDLYRAGMKSFGCVQLMLALEEAFDIEFPESMVMRATFRSPAAIEQAVHVLRSSSDAQRDCVETTMSVNAPRG